MGKIIETRVVNFTGGITNDPRDNAEGVAQVVTNFDILTDTKRMMPYRDSEDGDGSASTSKKQNFAIALRTGTTYSLYALGVVSGTARAEVLYKDLTTGGSNDLDDNAWATPLNNQSSAGTTSFNLFVYYKKTGYIYGARAGSHIWRFSPSGAAWVDDHQALSYTNIAQGLVHSKDDILYVPYDNKIAKNDNGSWNNTALTLPSHLYVTSICEYGNYLAIACAPLSGIGNSVVYLWDRDATLTTLSESIDWGEGVIKVLEELDGFLIGLSQAGGNSTRTKNRIIFRYYAGAGAVKIRELLSTTSPNLLIAKQKVDHRIFFMMSATLNGSLREGVWSIGRENSRFVIAHERTPNNDTALGNGILQNFFFVGDYLFIAYVNNSSANALSKTNDSSSFTATSIYESVIFNGGDSSLAKDLVGVTITTEPLPAAGSVVVKYKKDAETSYTTILTHSTDDAISKSAINIESTGAALPKSYKEISFRIESTGGAVITGLSFKEEITGKRAYD